MDNFQMELLSVLRDISNSQRRLARSQEILAKFWSEVYTTKDGRIGLLDLSTFKIEKMIRQVLKNSLIQSQKVALKQKKQEISPKA